MKQTHNLKKVRTEINNISKKLVFFSLVCFVFVNRTNFYFRIKKYLRRTTFNLKHI